MKVNGRDGHAPPEPPPLRPLLCVWSLGKFGVYASHRPATCYPLFDSQASAWLSLRLFRAGKTVDPQPGSIGDRSPPSANCAGDDLRQWSWSIGINNGACAAFWLWNGAVYFVFSVMTWFAVGNQISIAVLPRFSANYVYYVVNMQIFFISAWNASKFIALKNAQTLFAPLTAKQFFGIGLIWQRIRRTPSHRY